MTQEKNKLSYKQRLAGLWGVAKTTYHASPLAIFVKLAGAFVTSLLPLITTYFAALTTTELAAAYAGTPGAGAKAIEYVMLRQHLA